MIMSRRNNHLLETVCGYITSSFISHFNHLHQVTSGLGLKRVVVWNWFVAMSWRVIVVGMMRHEDGALSRSRLHTQPLLLFLRQTFTLAEGRVGTHLR